MTSFDSLTLGRMCIRDSFPNNLANYLRAEAKQGREAFASGYTASRHAQTLESLAGYVQSIGPGDQRLRAIELCQQSTDGTYQPGLLQKQLIAWVAGLGRPAQDNSDLLHELVAAAIEDLKTRHGEQLAEIHRDQEQAAKSLRKIDAYGKAAERHAMEAEQALTQLEAANAQLAEQERILAFFRRLHPDQEPKPASTRKDREKIGPNLFRRGNAFQVIYQHEGEAHHDRFDTLEAAEAHRDRLIEEGTIQPPRAEEGIAA